MRTALLQQLARDVTTRCGANVHIEVRDIQLAWIHVPSTGQITPQRNWPQIGFNVIARSRAIRSLRMAARNPPYQEGFARSCSTQSCNGESRITVVSTQELTA